MTQTAHIPERTCVGCKQRGAKRGLMRLTLDGAGRICAGSELPGRGAYVHESRACFQEAVHNGAFPRAFRRKTQRIETDVLWASLTSKKVSDDRNRTSSSDEQH